MQHTTSHATAVQSPSHINDISLLVSPQCFNAVGLASGRASGL